TRIFQLMTTEAEQQDFAEPLDQVIRIRAVQEFTPAQAVAPLLVEMGGQTSFFSRRKLSSPVVRACPF
ncbi:MAG: hypothetical protein D3910_22920, partial [Candidatus Electrothrix sp. ATG2]|nr:hypothetical protein [Candidatus Electrothrix sp. ATG2]